MGPAIYHRSSRERWPIAFRNTATYRHVPKVELETQPDEPPNVTGERPSRQAGIRKIVSHLHALGRLIVLLPMSKIGALLPAPTHGAETFPSSRFAFFGGGRRVLSNAKLRSMHESDSAFGSGEPFEGLRLGA